MKFKKSVAISMIVACGLMTLILLLGILLPTSALRSLSGQKPAASTTKTVVTTDPATGKQVETTVQVDQQTEAQQAASTPTTPAASTPTTAKTTTPTQTGGTSGGTTPAPVQTPAKPVVSFSASPTSVTSGGSATLSWSATNSPTSCVASGSWSGAQAASGSKVVTPASTSTYTLTCTNAGGSDTKSASVTVSAPAPACGSGGTCHLSDIQAHNTSGNCWSAINTNGSGTSAYSISSSFLSLHQPKKSITNTLCGKAYTSNLSNVTSDHRNGATLGGSNYGTWINNFYIGPYN